MACTDGSEQRYQRLFDRYHGQLYAYCRRRTDAQTAADSLAETFLVAWRRIDDVPDGDAALGWLYGVARRVLSNEFRRSRRSRRLVARLRSDGSVSGPTPEVVVVRQERAGIMLNAVARLRPQDQEVLRLAWWEELPHAEIAGILGCSPNAASHRIHRAARRVAKEYQRLNHAHPAVEAGRGACEEVSRDDRHRHGRGVHADRKPDPAPRRSRCRRARLRCCRRSHEEGSRHASPDPIVYDLVIEGAVAYPDFDPVAAANGSGVAVVRSKVVTVNDGNGLQIEFLHAVGIPPLQPSRCSPASKPAPPTANAATATSATAPRPARPATCTAGTPLNCNDANVCTHRLLQPGDRLPTARARGTNGTACSDGNVCNGTETCQAGTCTAGTALNCNDGNVCTARHLQPRYRLPSRNAAPPAPTATSATATRAARPSRDARRNGAQLQRRQSMHGRHMLGRHLHQHGILSALG